MDALRWAVAGGVLMLVLVVAILRARRRETSWTPARAKVPDGFVPEGAPLAFVYFTSPLCAACLLTPGIARDAAPELAVVALSVKDRADVARALGIRETPTLLLVDAAGRIRYAREGNPDAAELWTYAREAWDSLDAEGRLPRVTA